MTSKGRAARYRRAAAAPSLNPGAVHAVVLAQMATRVPLQPVLEGAQKPREREWFEAPDASFLSLSRSTLEKMPPIRFQGYGERE
jgi:hypothetical protein